MTNLKGDIYGGVTAGIIALPLSLAFGVASELGAIAGLYGAILVGFFAAVFGGTKTQISGPTGPITVVIAAIMAQYHGDYKLVFFAIFLAGLFQIIFGLLNIGKLIKYIPYPVISGFMSGIGTIIILLQLNPLLGSTVKGNTIETILNFGQTLQNINIPTLFLSLGTLAIVFLTPRSINKKVPAPLLALFIMTCVSLFFGFDVKVIGEIPAELPNINLIIPGIDIIIELIPVALTIAVLGSIDSLLTSLVADSLTKERHNSNKELIGQGIGNSIAAMFGGLAGAGATMRTVVNIKSGGKTRLSGVIHSLLLAIILLGAAPLVKNIPMAVLAGILVKVGFDIIDYKFIKILRAAPKYDLAVMLFVFLITVFDDLIFAVGMGIVLSSLLFAASITRQTKILIEDVDVDPDFVCEEYKYKIRMVNIHGILFFGSTSRILTRVDDLLGTECLIINCKDITEMDISAVFALEDIIVRMLDKKVRVFLVLNNPKIAGKLLRLGLNKLISRKDIFFSQEKAIKKAQSFFDCAV